MILLRSGRESRFRSAVRSAGSIRARLTSSRRRRSRSGSRRHDSVPIMMK